jgi:heme-degrading monooxygenase HmoA
MIIRVFRARVRPGKQQQFELKVRELSIPLVRSQKGLIAFFSGRPMESSPDEFVMVTAWKDLEALRAFAGDDWNVSVIPDPERPLLEDSFVHHYEAIDSSIE